MEDYKYITIDGKQVRLHRYIMEKHLGKKLESNELVHHKDENIHNNEIENLEIVTRSNHMRLHKIGEKTRFKRRCKIDKQRLKYLYEECGLTIEKIAKKLKINYGVVWRRMKEYQIRDKMICLECGGRIEAYVRARLCNKCYHRNYQRAYRANKKAI